MIYTNQLPGDARYLLTARLTLRWSDMDAFGHVNNAMYSTYFAQVRVDWLRILDAGHERPLYARPRHDRLV